MRGCDVFYLCGGEENQSEVECMFMTTNNKLLLGRDIVRALSNITNIVLKFKTNSKFVKKINKNK